MTPSTTKSRRIAPHVLFKIALPTLKDDDQESVLLISPLSCPVLSCDKGSVPTDATRPPERGEDQKRKPPPPPPPNHSCKMKVPRRRRRIVLKKTSSQWESWTISAQQLSMMLNGLSNLLDRRPAFEILKNSSAGIVERAGFSIAAVYSILLRH